MNLKRIINLPTAMLTILIPITLHAEQIKQKTLTSVETTQNKTDCNTRSNVWLNIFIHGTVKPPLKIGDITRIRKDKIDNSFYDYSATFLRSDPRFYQYQPIQALGMQPIIMDNKKGNASAAFAEVYNIQYQREYPNEVNLYYTWGWSGLLSRGKRKEESKNLLIDLKKLINQYLAKGITPNIRIVGYSHGGNVVLNLALHKDAFDLRINECIFIGMPVHMETDCLTNSPIFQKIYQVYSIKDRAQAADVFSTNYLFSHRKFKDRQCCKMPKNKIVHICLSTTYTILDPVCKNVTRSYKVDPRHIELWSFGWKPKSYRKYFPLYPLSAASILPFVIYKTKGLGDDILVEINPYQEKMRITSWLGRKKQDMWTIPFFSQAEFDNLAKTVLKYQPTEYKLQHYECIVRDALVKALNKQKDMFYTCLRSRPENKRLKEYYKTNDLFNPVTNSLNAIETILIN